MKHLETNCWRPTIKEKTSTNNHQRHKTNKNIFNLQIIFKINRFSFRLQKTVFGLAKGLVLASKRPSFIEQKTAFCKINLNFLNIRMLRQRQGGVHAIACTPPCYCTFNRIVISLNKALVLPSVLPLRA